MSLLETLDLSRSTFKTCRAFVEQNLRNWAIAT